MSASPVDFILASLLAAYPAKSFGEHLQVLLGDEDLRIPDELRGWLMQLAANPQEVDELRSEYIECFDTGRHVNPLYETEYGRNRSLAKGNELADVAGFYQAFGFELQTQGEHHEMLDHIAVEMEFYALLMMKQAYLTEEKDQEGVDILLDARKKFLDAHLGRFVRALSERPGIQASAPYSLIFRHCCHLVEQECADLGLTPHLTSYEGEAFNTDDSQCGSSDWCNKAAGCGLTA